MIWSVGRFVNRNLERYPRVTLAAFYSAWAVAVVALFCMLTGCAVQPKPTPKPKPDWRADPNAPKPTFTVEPVVAQTAHCPVGYFVAIRGWEYGTFWESGGTFFTTAAIATNSRGEYECVKAAQK